MAFGPESTNPRERRAYAHAMLARARSTGSDEDLALAKEAVSKAGNSNKSRASGFSGAVTGVVIGAAMTDYDTRIIVKSAERVLDPELTPRKSLTEPGDDDTYLTSARRYTPGYFSGNSRLSPLSMGRTETIDEYTGQLVEASELAIEGYHGSKVVIPTNEAGNVDVMAIREMPDAKRFSIARAAAAIIALDSRPEDEVIEDRPTRLTDLAGLSVLIGSD